MATPGMAASLEWTDGKRYLWMLGALTITVNRRILLVQTVPAVAALALALGWFA